MPFLLERCYQRQAHSYIFSSVQSFSRVQLFVTPWTAVCQAITNSQSPPKPMSIESVMPSSHLILIHFNGLYLWSASSVLVIVLTPMWSHSFLRELSLVQGVCVAWANTSPSKVKWQGDISVTWTKDCSLGIVCVYSVVSTSLRSHEL